MIATLKSQSIKHEIMSAKEDEFMSKNKPKQSLVNIIVTALFAAICYVALFFMIPLPSPVGNPFIHLGNLFVILAALLFSGTVGGVAGSIGMGLFDLTHGYAIYAPKTFVLKLGIGLIVGYIFSKGKKENAKSPVKWMYISSISLILIGVITMWLSLAKGNDIVITGIKDHLTISPVLYIFSIVLGALLCAAAVFAKKLPIKIQYALLASVCGIFFNLLGEFLLGALYFVILQGSALTPAIIASAISLPATLINGTFSIVGAVVLYVPLEKALKKSGFIQN